MASDVVRPTPSQEGAHLALSALTEPAARESQGPALLIGPTSSGKSTVIDGWLATRPAGGRGLLVRPPVAGDLVPLSLVHAVCARLAGAVRSPQVRTAVRDGSRLRPGDPRVLDAVRTCVQAATEAENGPTLVVVDDTHRADTASLALLHDVLALLEQAGVQTLLVSRSEHPEFTALDDALSAAGRGRLVGQSSRWLQLPLWTETDVVDLVQTTTDCTPHTALVDHLLRVGDNRAGVVVAELQRLRTHGGVLAVDRRLVLSDPLAGTAVPDDHPLIRRVRSLGQTPWLAARLLAAVDGADRDELAHLLADAPRHADPTEDVAGALERSEIAHEEAGRFQITIPAVAVRLATLLPPLATTSARRRLASLRGESALGVQVPGPRAADGVGRPPVARRARARQAEEAIAAAMQAQHWEAACDTALDLLALCRTTGDDPRRALMLSVVTLVAVGRAHQALRLLDDEPTADEGRGDADGVASIAPEARFSPVPDLRTFALAHAGRHTEALAAAAYRSPDVNGLAGVLGAVGHALASLTAGRVEDCFAVLEALPENGAAMVPRPADVDPREDHDDIRLLGVLFPVGVHLSFAAATGDLWRTEHTVPIGHPAPVAIAQVATSYLRGDWDGVVDVATLLRVREEALVGPLSAVTGPALAAEVCTQRGQISRARGWLESAGTPPTTHHDEDDEGLLDWSWAGLQHLQGDLETAAGQLRDALQRGRGRGRGTGMARPLARLVVIEHARGRTDAAAVALTELQHLAADYGRGSEADVLWRGRRALLGCEDREAATAVRQARHRGVAWDLAETCLIVGGDVGRTPELLLPEAYELFISLGALPAAARTIAAMRRHDLPAPRSAGSGDLTLSEVLLGRLVADGLSNRSVANVTGVTEKSVEAGLRRLFKKLGVRSRVDLARAWYDRRLDPQG